MDYSESIKNFQKDLIGINEELKDAIRELNASFYSMNKYNTCTHCNTTSCIVCEDSYTKKMRKLF
jgi:hypothetical protein